MEFPSDGAVEPKKGNKVGMYMYMQGQGGGMTDDSLEAMQARVDAFNAAQEAQFSGGMGAGGFDDGYQMAPSMDMPADMGGAEYQTVGVGSAWQDPMLQPDYRFQDNIPQDGMSSGVYAGDMGMNAYPMSVPVTQHIEMGPSEMSTHMQEQPPMTTEPEPMVYGGGAQAMPQGLTVPMGGTQMMGAGGGHMMGAGGGQMMGASGGQMMGMSMGGGGGAPTMAPAMGGGGSPDTAGLPPGAIGVKDVPGSEVRIGG